MNPTSIFSSFAALVSAWFLALLPLSAATFGLFTYTDNGTSITITDYPSDAVGSVTIPASIAEKPVTSIGNYAFYGCSGLTGVSMPNSVTSIGIGAFNNCTGLTSVSIPGSVTSIGNYAFWFCSGLTTISIPSSVTTIGISAFDSCTGLASVTIGSNVASIGYPVFHKCTRLVTITVAAENAFYGSLGGVLFNRAMTELIRYPLGRLGSYDIPSGVTSLGIEAFKDCTGLTSVSIPGSVTSIGGSAFLNCTGLPSINIPNGVTSVGTSAFYGCTGLTSVNISGSLTGIADHAFYGCKGLTSVNIPNSVASIGEDAFSGCTGLTSVNISGSVISIGEGAFYVCTGLTSVNIPNSVTSIGISAFYGCTGLTSVNIPVSLTSISKSSFRECTGLTNVTIPGSVTTIGELAFYRCTGLTSVNIPGSMTSIGDNSFRGCTGLTSVNILGSVTSIGNSSFRDCTSLSSMNMPDNSVTSIGEAAFYGCARLTSVNIPDSVTSIGAGCYFGCTGLTSVNIPDSVTSIGLEAFIGCNSLTRAVFMGNAPTMGSNVFMNTADNLTIYYFNGAVGFTSPMWLGYPSVALAPEISVQQPVGTDLSDGMASVGFGSVALGANAAKTFTIRNTGTADLTSIVTSKSGSHAGDFVVSGPSQSTLAPGASMTFTVAFKPMAPGSRFAALQIASNDSDENPFDITLTGAGVGVPAITVQQPTGTGLKSGGARSFGTVALKSTVTKTFTIQNTGTANLTSLSVSRSGTNTKDFVVKAPLKTTLAPGAKTTFKVIFKPSAKGTRKALLRIRSNDKERSPFEIVLTGKGGSKAKSAVVKSARLPSWRDLAASGDGNHSHQTVGTATLADGGKYLTLTVSKTPGGLLSGHSVEVSPNLIDWYSGSKHTTILIDDASLLKVRDNVPLTPGNKRYIRMKAN